MKRSGSPKRKTPLKRSGSVLRKAPPRTTPKRAPRAELQRTPPKRAAKTKVSKPKLPRIPRGTRCYCGCGRRATHWHHGIKEKTIERRGGNTADPRILLPANHSCHWDGHWSAFRRFRVKDLPDSVFEFAYELMGPAAYDEIRRLYEGDDPRLTALLREA